MSENRTPPFCCQHILPQTPFHKYEHYQRAYTCVLDFLHLATRIPNYVPQTSLSKALTQHDFVIRLCKGQVGPHFGQADSRFGKGGDPGFGQGGDPGLGQTGPRFGINPARYFLYDPDVQGCLVEVVDSPIEQRSSSLQTLKFLLRGKGGSFGGFLFFEDVYMTILCPVHRGDIWFLQFWTKGPRNREHLEEVTQRVRRRLNNEPGFVEDPFTARFNEMMGIPARTVQQERDSSGSRSIGDFTYGVSVGDEFGKMRDEQEEEDSRQHLGAQRKDLFRFPPELRPPPGFGPIPTGLAPSDFLPQQNFFLNNRQQAPNLPPGISNFNRGVDHPVSARVLHPQYNIGPIVHPPTTMKGYAQARGQGFLGTALQWADPALRAGFTPHRPTLAPPGLFDCQPDIPLFHSPQPSRPFDMANMWQGSQLQAAQPEFLPQHEPVLERVTNISDASAHTPLTGVTSGLRPIERRAWDDGEKKWKSYWVWSS